MNDTQYKALLTLIDLFEGDPVAQAELQAYGNAYDHIVDYVADQTIKELEA
jgi:hypothetical protein